MSSLRSPSAIGARNVVAVLGPTNTGKTHLAIERMLAHQSGVIGLPLRLLAREVYDRVAARAGASEVALITGEEKILPPKPRYRVCTVEAMPAETDASFLAIDEIQLAGDLERGHVFTDRILNLRGRDETLLLGAATMRGIVEKLVPAVNVVTRPRMSVLAYAGQKKITRLPRRSAVVAFSADEVYAIAELIRRQRGGAAVVLGALSPRTRNAQVELFQSGDVDFLVATDAIGMGLNLDVDHVAFASDRKFDGYQYRRLTAAELGQIAGRAGRHMRDGTFGVTGRAEPFEDALVEALENHKFDPVKVAQWRNRDLDFSSLETLRLSLEKLPDREGLVKAPPAEDVSVLDVARRDEDVRRLADRPARVSLLWEVCQIPDYRRLAMANHAELVVTLFRYLAEGGVIDPTWFASQVAYADRIDGDIDTLANRIAHIRTWTFIANRPQWLAEPEEWRETTRAIEDRLSDALHERLTQRFVDRRTSVLMRRLRENAMLETEVTATGDVIVEGQHVGQLRGFRFDPDPNAAGPDGKALRAAAQKALSGEIEKRAEKVANAASGEFVLSADGLLRWQGDPLARLVEGEEALKPRLILLAEETLTGPPRDRVQARVDLWLATHLDTLLKPLFELQTAADLAPLARGIAFRLVENLGVLERSEVASEVKELDQTMRASLRRIGVRFGAYNIYLPALLKPAPARLLAMLWGLKHGGLDTPGIAEVPQAAANGRTTISVDPAFPRELYRASGYRLAGPRAVRLDILERLADLIRPALAWRPGTAVPPPPGAVDGRSFMVTVSMTSLLGCAGEDFAAVLRSLNYRMDRRPPPKFETPAPAPAAANGAEAAPAAEAADDTAGDGALPEASEEAVGEAEGFAGIALAEAPEPVAELGAAPVAPEAAEALPAVEEESPGGAEAQAEEAAQDIGTMLGMPGAGADDGQGAEAPAEAADAEAPAAAAGSDAEAGTSTADAVSAPPEPTGVEEADAAPAEPELVEVWRPVRHDRPPRRAERGAGQNRPQRMRRHVPAEAATAAVPASPAEGGGNAERGPRPPRRGPPGDKRGPRPPAPGGQGRGAPPPRPREKPIDPSSPFAALAALKAELERRKQE